MYVAEQSFKFGLLSACVGCESTLQVVIELHKIREFQLF